MTQQIPPSLGAPSTLDRNKAAAATQALIDYVSEVTAFPDEEIEPKALSTFLGAEPSALFAWVRDNTSLVAYRGTLRGAEGVMIDRVGNSLDRSLLLAALFQAHGVKTRLARGQIDADSAQALLIEATGQLSGMAVGGAGEDPAALKRILVEQAGLNPDAVDQRLAILGENQTAATGKANTRLRTVGADVLTLALPAAEGTPESR
ncbi:MAG: hypothetical protein OEY16_12055, partial [Alphaproteobacteria bacterium]|nr:hypothetical protein [Alphaproteobacteria bacterium]